MNEKLESFILQIPDLQSKTSSTLIDYFVYFITVILEEETATPAGVERCFEVGRLQKYSNIAAYLSKCSKRGSTTKFIKLAAGYQLERNVQLEIQKSLHSGPSKLETSHLLRGLLSKLATPEDKSFLLEAIDCYEIGARRAAIVMTWLLTINHLYSYIYKNHLAAFNTVLAANKDKRIKITSISKLDDFSEIPEGKFIEFLRASKVISNDVRKILDTKLGIRNTSAHPSAVSISEVKATDFIIDLVENIIIKYET